MICFDECGPLELRPLHGRSWAPAGHPVRLRATYRRLQGTEQLLAFYDVHANCLVGQVRKRKTHRDLLEIFAGRDPAALLQVQQEALGILASMTGSAVFVADGLEVPEPPPRLRPARRPEPRRPGR